MIRAYRCIPRTEFSLRPGAVPQVAAWVIYAKLLGCLSIVESIRDAGEAALSDLSRRLW